VEVLLPHIHGLCAKAAVNGVTELLPLIADPAGALFNPLLPVLLDQVTLLTILIVLF
jgi:hypothetical protein